MTNVAALLKNSINAYNYYSLESQLINSTPAGLVDPRDYIDVKSRHEAMAELSTVHDCISEKTSLDDVRDMVQSSTDSEYGSRMLHMFSRVLGYTLIATMTLSQIPQIVKLLRKRSASGISILSILLMLEASTATVAYAIQNRFPVSAWGENIVLMHENVIVVCLLLRYSERLKLSMSFLLIYILFVLVLLWPSVPRQILWFLYLCSMPAIFASRVIQMFKNHKSKDPGQLSAMSSFLCIFQGFGRLTTSILMTGDGVMIYTFAAVSVLNSMLFLQVLYYRYRLKKLK